MACRSSVRVKSGMLVVCCAGVGAGAEACGGIDVVVGAGISGVVGVGAGVALVLASLVVLLVALALLSWWLL